MRSRSCARLLATLALVGTTAAPLSSLADEVVVLHSTTSSAAEARCEISIAVESTTQAGPLDAFVLPVEYPADALEVLRFVPAGGWLDQLPQGALHVMAARREDGTRGVAVLAVLPTYENPVIPLVARSDGGQPQKVADLVVRLRTDGVPAAPLEVSFADDAVGFGNGPPFKTSLVIGGEDYFSGAIGGRTLDLRPGMLTIGEVPGDGFRRGDANGDCKVNITDPIFTLRWLFLGGNEPSCPDAADATDDGKVNITDPIFTLGYLFLGGDLPPAPGPSDCGQDPTCDGLPACQGPACCS